MSIRKLFKRKRKKPKPEEILLKYELQSRKYEQHYFDEVWKLELKRDKDAYVS